jgi:CubicO group peptidase (beta-lactamase class C family)
MTIARLDKVKDNHAGGAKCSIRLGVAIVPTLQQPYKKSARPCLTVGRTMERTRQIMTYVPANFGRREILAGAGVALLASRTSEARAAAPGPALAAFEQTVRATMAAQSIPGLTIGYTLAGQEWVRGYGLADLENAVPTTPDTAYRYASVQKPMTAVAVLQMAERGKIDLDADIRTYVPYFPRKPFPVTARQLLGHVGGIPDYEENSSDEHLKQHMTMREAIAVFADRDLASEPGTTFRYSSFGYNLLAAAVEAASGQAFGEYLRDHVWAPAGMTSARMDDPLAIIPHRARGYQFVDGTVRNSEFVDVSSRPGGGAARGTVPDLLRFADALADGRLLAPASLSLMTTPTRTRDGRIAGFPRTQGYAMGWSVLEEGGGPVLFHDGGQPETRTMLILAPARKLAIASAQNFERDIHPPLAFGLWSAATQIPFPIGRS